MLRSSASRTSRRRRSVSTEDYNAFIRQIDLRDIWLKTLHLENIRGPVKPEKATVEIETKGAWEPSTDAFEVTHQYTITINEDGELAAEIELTFGLLYHSEQAMTDAIFRLFEDVNLPVNTWPYLRVFLSDSTGRMGWPPLTLPAFKVGVGEPRKRPSSSRSQSKPTE